MNLLIDIGNTRVKWGTETDGAVEQIGAAAHAGASMVDALAKIDADDDAPQRVIVASVAGTEVNDTVTSWVEEKFELVPE
ncbi:MAG: type III pantothenate kinase, partial [Gammaproteobacteria bacterium]|nr:type III pantothenate kinase [Gammaproteobacteria bacterium]